MLKKQMNPDLLQKVPWSPSAHRTWTCRWRPSRWSCSLSSGRRTGRRVRARSTSAQLVLMKTCFPTNHDLKPSYYILFTIQYWSFEARFIVTSSLIKRVTALCYSANNFAFKLYFKWELFFENTAQWMRLDPN